MSTKSYFRNGLLAPALLFFAVVTACTSTSERTPAAATDGASSAAATDRPYTPGMLRHLIWYPDSEFKKAPAGMEAQFKALDEAYARTRGAIVQVFGPADGVKTWSEYTPAQKRYRAMLVIARQQAAKFFAELRAHEPVFFMPGDAKEKPTYILSRYYHVDEAFGTKTQKPKDLAVIYTVPMEGTVKGKFMLSDEGTFANKEKFGDGKNWPKKGMHHMVSTVPHKSGDNKAVAMKRVRQIAKKLTLDSIRDNAGANEFDVGAHVARTIALGIVGEYFGFYPPDYLTQVQWSRNTQQSFFHNTLIAIEFELALFH